MTEICNLACPFCAYSRALPRLRSTATQDEVERLGALIGAYARQAQRPALVSWLGGEPLLWKPIFEISQWFRHEFGLQISATTNGTALHDAQVQERILEDFEELTVSVDGLAAVHDGWRGRAGLWASLEANVRQLAMLKARAGRGPRLRVNTILMHDTVRDFEALCQRLSDWRVEEVTFNALGGRDRPEFFPEHGLCPEDVAWLRGALPDIRARLAPTGLTILGNDHYLDRLAASTNNYQSPITNCHPGTQFWFIDEQGWIAPCSYTGMGYGIHASEIETVKDLAQLPQRFAERQRANLLAVCGDCPSTQVFGKFEQPA